MGRASVSVDMEGWVGQVCHWMEGCAGQMCECMEEWVGQVGEWVEGCVGQMCECMEDWDKFRKAVERENWNIGHDEQLAERGDDKINDKLVRKLAVAAEASIGKIKKKKGKKRNSWWTPKIGTARKERRELNRKCRRLRKMEETAKLKEQTMKKHGRSTEVSKKK